MHEEGERGRESDRATDHLYKAVHLIARFLFTQRKALFTHKRAPFTQ